jgi:hypothetical protein
VSFETHPTIVRRNIDSLLADGAETDSNGTLWKNVESEVVSALALLLWVGCQRGRADVTSEYR